MVTTSLLMEFIERFPYLQKHINEKIELFKTDRKFRHKSIAADIGEFISMLFSSKYKYHDNKKSIT